MMECDNCKGKVALNISQTIFKGQLRWSYSYFCDTCDDTIEFDDIGIPPEKYREVLLMRDGIWTIKLKNTDNTDIAKLFFALKKILNLSMAQLKTLKRKGSTQQLVTGTSVEMEWLMKKLYEFDIESTVTLSNSNLESVDISLTSSK